MTNHGELLKLAAARIVKNELEKEAQLGSLLGLAALGFAGTKLFPDQWTSIKDWISNKLRGPGAVEVDDEEEDRPAGGYRPAFDSSGRPIPYRTPYWGGRSNNDYRGEYGEMGKRLNMPSQPKRNMLGRLRSGMGYKDYDVESGDTLSGIANTYGMDLQSLLNANKGIEDPNMINVGQDIRLPVGRGR